MTNHLKSPGSTGHVSEDSGFEVWLGAPSQQADNEGVQALLFAFGLQSELPV